ncbi:MAG: tyrosine-type recombinase/integrase [Bacillota bacterium]
MTLRKDRQKEFRKKIYSIYNNQCCFKPSLVPIWCIKNRVPEEEKEIRCDNTEKLKIFRKDGNINNNSEDNILLLCPYHYGVVYHELRTMVKKKQMKRKGMQQEKKIPVVLTKDEYEKLLTEAVKLNHKYGYMISFMYFIGPRVNELIQLQKKDILINKKIVHLNADITKRKKERIVSIPDKFVSSLREYISKLNPDDKLFDYTKQRVWQIIKKASKNANIKKDIHPHTLRHTYGTTVYENTNDIRLTQELMGHKNMATTSIYTHLSDKYKKKGVNKAFK